MSESQVISLPVLPLRDIVVFPHMIVPLFVGREKSIKALEAVMAEDKQIILVTQTKADLEEPDAAGLHVTGTVGSILQLLKLPDGAVKVLVEGGERVQILPKASIQTLDFCPSTRSSLTSMVTKGLIPKVLPARPCNNSNNISNLTRRSPQRC